VGARFSAPVHTGPGAHPVSCTMDSGSFPGVKSSRGVTLAPHPLLVPWSWKSRAIRLLFLWAVRSVQSLSACTRVHFTFFYIYSVIQKDGLNFVSLYFKIRNWWFQRQMLFLVGSWMLKRRRNARCAAIADSVLINSRTQKILCGIVAILLSTDAAARLCARRAL